MCFGGRFVTRSGLEQIQKKVSEKVESFSVVCGTHFCDWFKSDDDWRDDELLAVRTKLEVILEDCKKEVLNLRIIFGRVGWYKKPLIEIEKIRESEKAAEFV